MWSVVLQTWSQQEAQTLVILRQSWSPEQLMLRVSPRYLSCGFKKEQANLQILKLTEIKRTKCSRQRTVQIHKPVCVVPAASLNETCSCRGMVETGKTQMIGVESKSWKHHVHLILVQSRRTKGTWCPCLFFFRHFCFCNAAFASFKSQLRAAGGGGAFLSPSESRYLSDDHINTNSIHSARERLFV